MKLKLEAAIRRRAALGTASPWYARKVTASVWIHAAALVLAFTSGAVTAVLLRRTTTAKPEASPAALFVKVDSTTQGGWKGFYGSAGFALANDDQHLPAYAKLRFPSRDKPVTWVDEIDEVRALQTVKPRSRIAAAWWSWGSFDIDIHLSDDKPHQISLYLLDWDSDTRVENIEVLDTRSEKIIDARQASKFTEGKYVVWNISGHVVIRLKHVAGANAVASAVFFD